MPNFLSRNETLAKAVKNYAKAVFKVFQRCSIRIHFFTLYQIFYPGLQTLPCLNLWLLFLHSQRLTDIHTA